MGGENSAGPRWFRDQYGSRRWRRHAAYQGYQTLSGLSTWATVSEPREIGVGIIIVASPVINSRRLSRVAIRVALRNKKRVLDVNLLTYS